MMTRFEQLTMYTCIPLLRSIPSYDMDSQVDVQMWLFKWSRGEGRGAGGHGGRGGGGTHLITCASPCCLMSAFETPEGEVLRMR